MMKDRVNEIGKLTNTDYNYEVPVDENGYTTFVLWDLMYTFGKEMYIGGVLPFESNIQISENQLVDKPEEKSR